MVGGNVSALTVEGGVATASFSGLSDSNQVVIALHNYNESTSSQAFQVGSDESIALLVDGDLIAPEEDAAGESEWDETDLTEEFHMMLRQAEEGLDEDEDAVYAIENESDERYLALTRTLTTGSSRSFRVLSSFSDTSKYTTVTATLRYQTDDFEFWVDDRDVASLDDADLAALASDFSAALPLQNSMFGTESDVNDDGKFAALFTRVVNGLGGSSGGIVTGFFYATDLFNTSQYPNSNQMEIFYALVPDPDGSHGSAVTKSFAITNLIPGVLVHEYQHAISFNQHYFINGGASEESWLNEGLSHLAEDIHSRNSGGFMPTTGIENPARVYGYLANISNICFSCGSSLNQRGGSYLFLRYLYEQAEVGNLGGVSSGSQFISTLLNTSRRGVANVVYAAIGSAATSSQFKDLLGNFSVALYLSNTGQSTSNQLGLTGINLRASQSDNRGTVLNGPAVQGVTSMPFTDTISGSGITYMQFSGSTINAQGGSLSFTFGSGSNYGGYIITN